jgi:hypothetical protein
LEREQGVKINDRRYAHLKCSPNEGTIVPLPEDYDEELTMLENYIKDLFHYAILPAKIKKDIEKYKNEEGYTYSGMLKALRWWFEIRKNPISKANRGIGILPYIYDEAKERYRKVYEAETLNIKTDLTKPTEKVVYKIPSPRFDRQKMISMEDRTDDEQ